MNADSASSPNPSCRCFARTHSRNQERRMDGALTSRLCSCQNFLTVSAVSRARLLTTRTMNSTKNSGRFAGLLYVLVSIPGAFALMYVPSKLIVPGNATVTAGNILAHQTLFRFGIAAQLISQILFMWLALALYDLLKGVNQRQASLMLGLIMVSTPMALLNELNVIAALILVRGADFLSIFEKPQRDALAMLFLNLHSRGSGIAGIFWGLWLFPLGLLVYRSGFFPRIL